MNFIDITTKIGGSCHEKICTKSKFKYETQSLKVINDPKLLIFRSISRLAELYCDSLKA